MRCGFRKTGCGASIRAGTCSKVGERCGKAGSTYSKTPISCALPSPCSLFVENKVAWVCCTEKIYSTAEGRFDSAHVQSTNIFERHNGKWYVVHHHASPLPEEWGESAEREVVQ